MLFRDRADAGRHLLSKLGAYRDHPDVLVLGLPRGGIPVAYEVARGLGAPLDVFVVRKLGVPGQEELAMGAIATGGVRVVNREVVDALHIPPAVLDRAAAEELRELERREQSIAASAAAAGRGPDGHPGGRGLAGSTMRRRARCASRDRRASWWPCPVALPPRDCAARKRWWLCDAGALHGRRSHSTTISRRRRTKRSRRCWRRARRRGGVRLAVDG